MLDSVPIMKTINDYKASQKQGILTILPSSSDVVDSPTLPPPSLRRTLSADMSSTNWSTRHGFSPIKKIASSQAFSVSAIDSSASSSSSSSSEGEEDFDDFKQGTIGYWNSVQEHQEKKKIDCPKQGDLDLWTSIVFQNSPPDAPKSSVVPYVHPLVKKSTNSLTENSLLICTESLGSETGSDGFSDYSSSEAGDFDGEITKTEYPLTEEFEWKPVKFARKKSPPRSFPPPISSLSTPDGDSVCIQSRRENGRLVIDAVSVPSQKNFRAERRDGRLILSFVTTPANLNVQEEEDELEELIAGEFEEVKESGIAEEKDNEHDLEAEELEIPMEKAPRLSSSVMNFHRLAMMMKKPNGSTNRNPAWPKEKDAAEPPSSLSQSLPPRPPSLAAASTTAAASLNAYEYYWRSKPTGKSTGIQNPNGQQQIQPMKSVTGKLISSNNQMANEKQQILVLRGNRGDYLVPLSNGCKVPRRSLLLREPCCIATT